jgi:Fe2+ or Zn2+ uptake regulation protein
MEIIRILKNEDMGLSIQSILRAVRKKFPSLHRLTLTGYLHALADLQLLERRSVPPSIVFSLAGSSVELQEALDEVSSVILKLRESVRASRVQSSVHLRTLLSDMLREMAKDENVQVGDVEP